MLCTHHTFCTKMERGYSNLRSNPYNAFGNTIDLLNPSSDQVIAASGNPPSVNLSQFASHRDNCTSHTDLYHQHWHQQQQQQQRQQHPASNYDLDSVGWSNFENSYTNSSSSSNYFCVPVTASNQLASSSTRGVSRHHHSADDPRGSCKDKNAVEVPRDHVNGVSPLNLSLNSGMQNWDEPCEVGFNMMDATNFNASGYRHGFLPLIEGCQPDITHLPMESPFWHHHNHNHSLPGNYFSPIFPPGFAWVEQHRNNVGVSSMWNNPAIPYFEGSLNFGNMGSHQGSSVGRSAVIFHPSSSHSQHHLQPVQGMQVPNYSHHPRIAAFSYGLSVNNLLHHRIISTSGDGVDSVTSVPRPFPSNADGWSYRRHLPLAPTDPSGNQMRILSAQENAAFEFPSFHGADNLFDRHRDMRLDIDNMSYEELLALEEQIGDVKTGLPEETILNNLKTRTFSTPASLLNPSSDTTCDGGTCIICQVLLWIQASVSSDLLRFVTFVQLPLVETAQSTVCLAHNEVLSRFIKTTSPLTFISILLVECKSFLIEGSDRRCCLRSAFPNNVGHRHTAF